MTKCEIKIIPKKEEEIALAEIIFENISPEKKQSFVDQIRKTLVPSELHELNEDDDTSLNLTLEYAHLEKISAQIESVVKASQIALVSKKIFIKKLGGWFFY